MGPFLGGETPRSSPRGRLGFRGESRVALDFIQKKIYICTTDWGIRYVQKVLEILSAGRSDVAVGCSKHW
jgi:hypothetical protein